MKKNIPVRVELEDGGKLPNNVKIFFGDDNDFHINFDASNDRFEIWDTSFNAMVLQCASGQTQIASPGDSKILVDDDLNMSGNGLFALDRCGLSDDSQLRFGTDLDIRIEYDSANAKLKLTGSDLVDETADGMTADPESASEDGFLTVEVGTKIYQIPMYSA